MSYVTSRQHIFGFFRAMIGQMPLIRIAARYEDVYISRTKSSMVLEID